LEVEIPFLQAIQAEFTFVPVAVGSTRFEELVQIGEGVAEVIAGSEEEILMVTSSDMNHYEEEGITRRKDQRAIECMLRLDAKGLYDVCRRERISMCGLGPAVVMLSALRKMGVESGELVKYATSGDISGEHDAVVGYAGIIFR
jgi:AmmeMemoRadiSam system protein B